MEYEIKRIEIVDAISSNRIKDWAPEPGQTMANSFSIMRHTVAGNELMLYMAFTLIFSPEDNVEEYVIRFHIKMDIFNSKPILPNVLQDGNLLIPVALAMAQTAERCTQIFSKTANENGWPYPPTDMVWGFSEMLLLIRPAFQNHPGAALS